MTEREGGTGSVQVFILLLFLSILAVGFSFELGQSFRLEKRISNSGFRERELDNRCRLIVKYLQKNSDPEKNTPEDSVWSYIKELERDGFTLSLEEVSSRIGKDLHPPLFDSSEWPDEYYSDYTWINSNLTDSEFSYPVANNMPLFNIYYTEEDLLEIILSHSYEGIVLEDWEGKFNKLINLRDSNTLDEDSLQEVLDLKDEKLEYYLNYLGVTTWFWKISAEKEGVRHTMVAARIPVENDRETTLNQNAVYQIIQSFPEKKIIEDQ